MDNLIFQQSPNIIFESNTFINVPIILKYEDINLIEIIKDLNLGFTTQIPIYHSDGTYLAKINGTRLFLTEEGKYANLTIDKLADTTVCKMNKQILFEIKHQKGDLFRILAELYTNDGCFLKCKDLNDPQLIDLNGNLFNIEKAMSNCTIRDVNVGMWIKKDGSCLIAVP